MHPVFVASLPLAVVACSPGGLPEAPAPPAALTPGLDAGAVAWVDDTVDKLTLEQAILQLVIPWIPGSYQADDDPEFEEVLAWVDRGLGGVSISIGVPDAYVSKLNRLQRRAEVPLLVTSDFENGGPGMRINHAYALPSLLSQGGGTSFPPTMAFGALGDEGHAFEYGRITATEARAVGVHWLFAPVMDVNSNPENPIINTRSFGEDPVAVGRLGAAFIRGARAGGALTTAKHFPGHGDTRTDSHVELPIVEADRQRLEELELVPFRMAVDAGVDAVMTAHVAVPGVLGNNRPATLSPVFMTDVLRESLGFEGILFTDALRMGALTQGYGGGEVAVLAIAAGSDVLLAPADIEESVEAVVEAVGSGRLTRDRIDESVRRLLVAKARLGLHKTKTVDPRRVATVVGSDDHNAAAKAATEGAITLVRDAAEAVPFGGGRRILSVSYAREGDLLAGRTFNGTIRAFAAQVRTASVGPDTPWPVYDSLLRVAEDVDAVVVGAYLPPRSGAGATQLPLEFRTFLERASSLREDGFALISFGNPYLLAAVPEVGTYMVAWGDREHPQEAAARALVGAAAIGGRLPISIPPLHRIGAGLVRTALPDVAAVASGGIDPLQEAGFIPGADEPGEEDAPAGPTGGPGRWAPGEPLPECPVRQASRTAFDLGESDDADSFCRTGRVVASPREVDATAVGMSPDSLAALDQFISSALADSAASGASLAVIRRGQLVRLRGYGRLDWDSAAPAATPASIFDLASLTKVVGTTSAAMVLAQRGAVDLEGRVVDYLPWWSAGDPRKDSVTLRHLLLHQAGLPPFRRFFLEMEGRDAYQEAIGDLPLDYPPGDSTVYSDIGLMTLGFVVESVSGKPLDEFLRAEIWSPLGMDDTDFNPAQVVWDRVATTEVDASFRGAQIHGEVHDENAFAIGGVVGHAGLFSSARDLAVFAQMMLDRGTAGACSADLGSGLPCHRARFRPVTVFQPGWVDAFTRRHSDTSSRAMGWDTPSTRSSAGDYFTPRAYGHTGYTGTSIWIDPTLDVAVVLLTNRVNPTRENTKHIPLRRGVHDRVARAIVDRPVPRRDP